MCLSFRPFVGRIQSYKDWLLCLQSLIAGKHSYYLAEMKRTNNNDPLLIIIIITNNPLKQWAQSRLVGKWDILSWGLSATFKLPKNDVLFCRRQCTIKSWNTYHLVKPSTFKKHRFYLKTCFPWKSPWMNITRPSSVRSISLSLS